MDRATRRNTTWGRGKGWGSGWGRERARDGLERGAEDETRGGAGGARGGAKEWGREGGKGRGKGGASGCNNGWGRRLGRVRGGEGHIILALRQYVHEVNIAQSADIIHTQQCTHNIRSTRIHLSITCTVFTHNATHNTYVYKIHTIFLTQCTCDIHTQHTYNVHTYMHTIYAYVCTTVSDPTHPTLSHTASRYPPSSGSSMGPYTFLCVLATTPSKWSRKS